MNEPLKQIEEIISYFEKEHFTGVFSESAIRADLDSRAASDRLSTFGSSGRQTDSLGQKKSVYFDSFYKDIDLINTALDMLEHSHPYVARLERCRNQVNKLSNIVDSY